MAIHRDISLVLLIGVPGSGKSTIARRWQARAPGRRVISTDAIRQELFGDAAVQGPWSAIWREVCDRWERVIAANRRGEQRAVLFDATHANRRDRRRVLHTARQIGFTSLEGYWLKTPLNLCLARNRQRSRQVPEFIIQRMHRQLHHHPPAIADGFDHLYTVLPNALDSLWTYPTD